MHRIMMSLGILSVPLFAAPSSAQEAGSYLRDADIHRAGNIVTVVANYPRPLEQVLEALLPESGWTVDYEDPPYQGSLELIDATAPAWKASHPDGPGATNIRGGAFRTSFAEPAEQSKVIRKIVDDYNSSGNPGQFEVRERADGRLAIVGISVKDASGAQLSTPSILDIPVAVPAASMNLHEAVTAILEALSARSGTKVSGVVPTNMGFQTRVKTSATPMPARDALREVLSQAKIATYWMMLYDPDSKGYFLNVQLGTRATHDAAGHRQLDFIRLSEVK